METTAIRSFIGGLSNSTIIVLKQEVLSHLAIPFMMLWNVRLNLKTMMETMMHCGTIDKITGTIDHSFQAEVVIADHLVFDT